MADLIRRPWTDKHDRQLIDLWPRVGSIVLIALELERSSSSVQTRASRLNLPRRLEGNDRHRRKWTDEDIEKLESSVARRVEDDGSVPICEIADDVGRSIDAVAAKLSETMGGEEVLFSKIKVTRKRPTPTTIKKVDEYVDPRKVGKRRPCMSCRKNFWSEGAHNRLCMSCKSGESASEYDY